MQKFLNALMIVAILVVGYMTFSHKATLGDATVSNYPTWYYNGIVVGPQNTLLSQATFGTCSLTGAASMASLATSTLSCSAPGAKSGDKVFVQQSNQSTSTPVVAAFASTTADIISVVIQNLSGATTVPSGVSITGVQYLDLR